MYITKIDVPMDAFEYAWRMNSENLHTGKIKQDVMVITGRDDQFIPFKLHAPLIKSLTNAKSVTIIVF
jgi:pimeloyl-ACP methyl ester carboxylesterase